MSVLEGIFEGSSFLTDIDFRCDPEYRKLCRQIETTEQKFLSALTSKQAEEFREIVSQRNRLGMLENEIIFKASLSYGIQFMGEVYNNNLYYFG